MTDRLADPRARVKRVILWLLPGTCLVAVALALLGYEFRKTAAWGDVPTWALAVTTFLAFVAAVFAGVVAYELLSVEIARDAVAAQESAQRRAAEREAQASKVAAWYGQCEETWGAVVKNASDLPVYDVHVIFCIAADPGSGRSWLDGVEWSPLQLTAVTPPGETTLIEFDNAIRLDREAERDETKWQVYLSFSDAAGNRWARDPGGQLRFIS